MKEFKAKHPEIFEKKAAHESHDGRHLGQAGELGKSRDLSPPASGGAPGRGKR